MEIGNTIQQQKPGFTIESRDKVYLIGFVVAAGLLLFLGRGLVQGSALATWGLTFGATTAVAVLLVSLYRVQLELQSSRRQLARKEAELSFALEVQQALFPRHLPESNGLEFSAVCIPARGISGDYYDVVQFPDGRLVFAIADISGKGISAAILMANVQALLRTLSKTGNPPAEVCKTVESSSSSGYGCLEVRYVLLCRMERGRTPAELCQRRTLCAGDAGFIVRPPVVGRWLSAWNVSNC